MIGFVLRAAGAVGDLSANRSVSGCWSARCCLALVLGLSKRRHQLTLLAPTAPGHRRILDEYNPYLLDQMIGVVTASTLMAYVIYVAEPRDD